MNPEQVEETIENLQLGALSLARIANDDGRRFDLDDVLSEAGIDPAELAVTGDG